jgi:hypothetical protein
MSNLVPRRYRGVSVAAVDVALTADSLREHFRGREAYRRTEFIVARREEGVALLRVLRAASETLFTPLEDVEVLAGPEECAFVEAPEADTAVPSALARVAREEAPGARCVIVEGRYHHVSFILDPAPIALRVVEVAPPRPAKLIDQVERVLAVAEDLPPADVRPQVLDLAALAGEHPAPSYLFPCRGSGAAARGGRVAYLDERPPRADWVLVGCRRSVEIHRWFYGDEPPHVEMCPRERTVPGDVATLTKCCMLESGIQTEGTVVTVPWGASLAEVREGLGAALRTTEPAWAPA